MYVEVAELEMTGGKTKQVPESEGRKREREMRLKESVVVSSPAGHKAAHPPLLPRRPLFHS